MYLITIDTSAPEQLACSIRRLEVQFMGSFPDQINTSYIVVNISQFDPNVPLSGWNFYINASSPIIRIDVLVIQSTIGNLHRTLVFTQASSWNRVHPILYRTALHTMNELLRKALGHLKTEEITITSM